MINGVNAGIIISIVVLETLSQSFARGYYDSGKSEEYIFLPIFSVLVYAPIVYLLIKAYDYSDFAITNAFWDSGTVIATALVGYFYFGEKFKWQELMGLGFVILGAIILGIYSEDTSKTQS